MPALAGWAHSRWVWAAWPPELWVAAATVGAAAMSPPVTRAAAPSTAVATRPLSAGRPKGLFEYKELPSMGGRFAGSGRAEELGLQVRRGGSGAFGGTGAGRSAVP